jgi:hypothetical protein
MPIKQSVTLDEVVEVLNRALEKDRGAISELILDGKVVCNEELAEDETVQVGKKRQCGKDVHTIGVLGLLNGFFGIDDDEHRTFFGAIAAHVGDDGVERFSKVDHKKTRQWLDDQEGGKYGQE